MTNENGLATLLAKIVTVREELAEANAVAKVIEKTLDSLESLAMEQIGASGLDQCRVAGKTWWIDEALMLSVPKENRDAVMEAARKEGLDDELLTINTATLKAWLVERCKENEGDLATASSGTAFSGLVTEYVKVRLRSLTVS